MHHGDVTPEIAAGLLALRARIEASKIPPSKLDETINVAVWNIREFGKVRRTDAAIHYIAEILGQFDLVALVELRDNLEDLGRVLCYLGDTWSVVYTDWIDDDGGNQERTAFLFDRRAVTFNGLAAELDVPRVKLGEEYLAQSSFWRAPYMCSFRAGNFDFLAIAVHARWGRTTWTRSRAKAARRMDRHPLCQQVRGGSRPHSSSATSIPRSSPTNSSPPSPAAASKSPSPSCSSKSATASSAARTSAAMPATIKSCTCPPSPKTSPTTAARSISSSATPTSMKLFPSKHYTREKFTYQLSDHLPIWLQMKTDIDGFRLEQIVQGGKG